MSELIISLVRDLESTRYKYAGYAYVTTIRNILTGNGRAIIAPNFIMKPYYGIYKKLSKAQTFEMLDALVKKGLLDYIISDKGKKLYCTHEYHDWMCRKQRY